MCSNIIKFSKFPFSPSFSPSFRILILQILKDEPDPVQEEKQGQLVISPLVKGHARTHRRSLSWSAGVNETLTDSENAMLVSHADKPLPKPSLPPPSDLRLKELAKFQPTNPPPQPPVDRTTKPPQMESVELIKAPNKYPPVDRSTKGSQSHSTIHRNPSHASPASSHAPNTPRPKLQASVPASNQPRQFPLKTALTGNVSNQNHPSSMTAQQKYANSQPLPAQSQPKIQVKPAPNTPGPSPKLQTPSNLSANSPAPNSPSPRGRGASPLNQQARGGTMRRGTPPSNPPSANNAQQPFNSPAPPKQPNGQPPPTNAQKPPQSQSNPPQKPPIPSNPSSNQSSQPNPQQKAPPNTQNPTSNPQAMNGAGRGGPPQGRGGGGPPRGGGGPPRGRGGNLTNSSDGNKSPQQSRPGDGARNRGASNQVAPGPRLNPAVAHVPTNTLVLHSFLLFVLNQKSLIITQSYK